MSAWEEFHGKLLDKREATIHEEMAEQRGKELDQSRCCARRGKLWEADELRILKRLAYENSDVSRIKLARRIAPQLGRSVASVYCRIRAKRDGGRLWTAEEIATLRAECFKLRPVSRSQLARDLASRMNRSFASIMGAIDYHRVWVAYRGCGRGGVK
jgi:hypothetical protein